MLTHIQFLYCSFHIIRTTFIISLCSGYIAVAHHVFHSHNIYTKIKQVLMKLKKLVNLLENEVDYAVSNAVDEGR